MATTFTGIMRSIRRSMAAGLALVLACWTQLPPALAQVSPTGSPAAAGFDLSSRVASMPVNSSTLHGSASATIRVGGMPMVVHAGQSLTPAEYAALLQVVSLGHQTLNLDLGGRAIGGSFSLNSLASQTLGSLVIPSGVLALDRSSTNPLDIAGALVSHGTLLGLLGTTPAVNIHAGSITVGAGGAITTVVPHNLQMLFGAVGNSTPTDLNLISASSIINSGMIAASGKLNLVAAGAIINQLPSNVLAQVAPPVMSGVNGVSLFAGSGNVLNAGTISSLSGGLNFDTGTLQGLHVLNSAGQLLATKGSIDFRTAAFSGKATTELLGGTAIAHAFNFYGGNGAVNVNADKIAGLLNVVGGTASIYSAQPTLTLGTIKLSGDPTIANSKGDVVLGGDLAFEGQDLTILASGDVVANGATNIDLSGTTTDGGTLHIFAGYNFTPTTSGQVFSGSKTYTVKGSSASGGSIELGGVNIWTGSVDGNGGNINLFASKGSIAVGNIDTSSTLGAGGSVYAIAPNGIVLGKTVLTTGANGNDGTVRLFVEQPRVYGGNIVIDTGGTNISQSAVVLPSQTFAPLFQEVDQLDNENVTAIEENPYTTEGGTPAEMVGAEQMLHEPEFEVPEFEAPEQHVHMHLHGETSDANEEGEYSEDMLPRHKASYRLAQGRLFKPSITVYEQPEHQLSQLGSVLVISSRKSKIKKLKNKIVIEQGFACVDTGSEGVTVETPKGSVEVYPQETVAIDVAADKRVDVMALSAGQGAVRITPGDPGRRQHELPVSLTAGEETVLAESRSADGTTSDAAAGAKRTFVSKAELGAAVTHVRRSFSVDDYYNTQIRPAFHSLRLSNLREQAVERFVNHVLAAGGAQGHKLLAETQRIRTVSADNGNEVQIYHTEDSDIKVAGNVVKLATGNLLLAAKTERTIDMPLAQVTVDAGQLAVVQSENGREHIKVLTGSNSASVKVGGRNINLSAGQELLIFDHNPSTTEASPADGIGRRTPKKVALEDGKIYLIANDFSVISAMSAQPLLHNLVRSTSSEHQKIIDRLLKTQAAINIATAARGRYSVGESEK